MVEKGLPKTQFACRTLIINTQMRPDNYALLPQRANLTRDR